MYSSADFNHIFLQVTDSLVNDVKDTEISIISQEIFDRDPLTRIQNLKVGFQFFRSLSFLV